MQITNFRQHRLHREHVTDGVPHCHVDHVQQRAQLVPALLLDHLDSVVTEHHCTMTISLKINSNVKI